MTGGMDAYSTAECLGDNTVSQGFFDPLPILNFSSGPSSRPFTGYLTDSQYRQIQFYMNHSLTAQQSESDFQIHYTQTFFSELPRTGHLGFVWIFSNATTASFVPCMFELGWFPSTAVHLQEQPPPQSGATGLRKARPNPEWLEFVNPVVAEINTTIFTDMIETATTAKEEPVTFASLTMSMLLTVALANMSPSFGPCTGYVGKTKMPNSKLSKGAAKAAGPSCKVEDQHLSFGIKYFLNGYGYGPNVWAVKVSLAILIMYCVVVVIHIAYSLWTGIGSSAWDSVAEVVALAINSRPARELQNTCAGVDTARVFKHPVRVAAAETRDVTRHLDLVFQSIGGRAAPVGINEEYGALSKDMSHIEEPEERPSGEDTGDSVDMGRRQDLRNNSP